MLPGELGYGNLYLFQKVVHSLFLIITVPVCACVFLFGVILLRRSVFLIRHGVRVEGLVVGNHVDPCDLERSEYRIVEFSDLQGNKRRRTLTVSSSDDPPVGQFMQLVYDPANPDDVSGASRSNMWMIPLICCALGGAGMLALVSLATGSFTTN